MHRSELFPPSGHPGCLVPSTFAQGATGVFVYLCICFVCIYIFVFVIPAFHLCRLLNDSVHIANHNLTKVFFLIYHDIFLLTFDNRSVDGAEV